jgi:hypothetical protein
VIADGKNDPDWIAADLLSQAEHDPTSQSILITDDAGFARQVEPTAVDLQIMQLATAKTARASWDAHGVMIVVNDLLAEAPALANRLAAEHVEIAVDDPEPVPQGDPPRREHLPWPDDARSRRRLCRWPQPRAAHRSPRALFERAVGARFHETHQLSRGLMRRPSPRLAPPPQPLPMPRVCLPTPSPWN